MPFALLNLPFSGMPALVLALLILAGFLALWKGGDWLTAGAAAISVNLRINPVVVGLTVVSIATSMPEMLTSLLAARKSPELALGNILGSNVANTGLILGVTAVIAPLAIQLRLIQRETPILVAATGLFLFLGIGGFERWEGILLLVLMAAYLVCLVRWSGAESDRVKAEFSAQAEAEAGRSTPGGVVLVVAGGALLALGAELLVGASVETAARLGVSEALIGLTIVAIGTSMPELAASIAAARAGHSDICAGNIVGSNLFNILLIGGGVATFIPIPVRPELLMVEFPLLFGLTLLLLWVFKTGHIVSRREGVFLLALYAGILTLSACAQLGYLF